MKTASRSMAIAAVLTVGMLIYIFFVREPAINNSPFAQEVNTAYPSASENVRKVAVMIREGVAPDLFLLSQIGQAALSQPYVGTNNQRSVLLNDTLLHTNFAAAEALVAAGADVRYTDDLMVFNALSMKEGRVHVPFPNYSSGLPFLRLYLENGGDPEVQYYRDNGFDTPLLYSFDNLAGELMLLEFGADPWRKPLYPEGTPMRSYFDSGSGGTGAGVHAELFFRVVHAGHMAGASQDDVMPIMETIAKFLDMSLSSGREVDLYSAWRLQEIMRTIIATTGVTPTPRQTSLLAQTVSDEYAGWFMAPDQFFSGDEYKGPMVPVAGDFVWTHADPTPRSRAMP